MLKLKRAAGTPYNPGGIYTATWIIESESGRQFVVVRYPSTNRHLRQDKTLYEVTGVVPSTDRTAWTHRGRYQNLKELKRAAEQMLGEHF